MWVVAEVARGRLMSIRGYKTKEIACNKAVTFAVANAIGDPSDNENRALYAELEVHGCIERKDFKFYVRSVAMYEE